MTIARPKRYSCFALNRVFNRIVEARPMRLVSSRKKERPSVDRIRFVSEPLKDTKHAQRCTSFASVSTRSAPSIPPQTWISGQFRPSKAYGVRTFDGSNDGGGFKIAFPCSIPLRQRLCTGHQLFKQPEHRDEDAHAYAQKRTASDLSIP